MKQSTIIILTITLCLGSQTLAQEEDFQRLISFNYCQYDFDCNVNSFCFGNDGVNPGKCKCKDNHVLIDRNRTHYECLPIAAGLNSPCLKDIQCQVNLGTSAMCGQSDQLCRCSEIASYGDGRCHENVALGEVCKSNFNCRLGDGSFGYCHIGRCACMIQHHPSEDGKRCIPTAALGQTCITSESCIHTFAKCYGNICKCIAGYIEANNNSVCLTAANKVGDSCIESVQCSAYITGSFCENDSCTCKSAHHGYGNECVPDSKLGERCLHDKQCILSPELHNSVRCTSGICTCIEGVPDQNSYGCVSNANIEKFKPVLYLVTLFLVAFYEHHWLI